MSWVWLSSPDVDFGGAKPGRDGDRCKVWLHADPFGALDLPRTAEPEEVRRAYWRHARLYHPDVAPGGPDTLARFQDIQSASKATSGEIEVSVEPTSGAWWRFSGFLTPDPIRRSELAIAGLTFELRDLRRVPLDKAEDELRISYAGQVLPLSIQYSQSSSASPVRLARAGAIAESALLALLCLALVPILAGLLALDLFVISNENAFVFWAVAIPILAMGYGALAVVLATMDKHVPFPRRAVLRTRAAIADLRMLSRGHHSPSR